MSIDQKVYKKSIHTCDYCGHTAAEERSHEQDGVKWYSLKGYHCMKRERCRARMSVKIEQLKERIKELEHENTART